MEKPSPFDDGFSPRYFQSLFEGASDALSAKAFLAREQRVPGLANGVLQDILFNARVHPKLKIATLDNRPRGSLYELVRHTLATIRDQGGSVYFCPGRQRETS